MSGGGAVPTLRESVMARVYDSISVCPKCKAKAVQVYDTRHRNGQIQRRRGCDDCLYRWSTVEVSRTEYIRLRKVARALGAALEVMEEPE